MALHRDRHPRAAEAIIETLLEPRLDAIAAVRENSKHPARTAHATRRMLAMYDLLWMINNNGGGSWP